MRELQKHVFDLWPLPTKRPITSPPSCVSASPGPSDRRPRDVQRHPEGLGCLPAASGSGLAAAPTAVAVVLQPRLLAGRLVASQAAAMDSTKSVCTKWKKKSKWENYILLLSESCCIFSSAASGSLFDFCNIIFFILKFILMVFVLLFNFPFSLAALC